MYYYEIYLDSVFFLSFAMNLYLFLVVDLLLGKCATFLRILGGVLVVSIGEVLFFLLPVGPTIYRLVAGGILMDLLGIKICFHPDCKKGYIRILGYQFIFTLLSGGVCYTIHNYFSFFRKHAMSVWLMVLIGGGCYLMGQYFWKLYRKQQKDLCRVILIGEKARVTVWGMWDTGNGLFEPISGRPVCIVDQGIFGSLCMDSETKGFRAIPYHSVGDDGIMKGYEIPEMVISQNGIPKSIKKVYICVSKKEISSAGKFRIILHPALMDGI